MNSRLTLQISKSEIEIVDIMKRSLLKSFIQFRVFQKCGILFSGGLDSSLAALLAKKYCNEVVLLTSCTEGSRDSQAALRAAELLNMKLVETRLSSELVWDTLPKLLHAIKSSQRMDIEIALPFFFSAQEARMLGIENIISGQGPDELFAGYARHLDVFREQGEEALQDMLHEEVSKTHIVNIERDSKAITYHGIAAHFPYLDQEFVKIALSVDGKWKVNPNVTPSRKVIFRKLAFNLGLPIEIAMKPKDATQYSSGSSKIIIDSVRDHVLNYESMSRKKASMLVQDVLNLIASQLGIPKSQPINPELEIDLKPTKDLVSRLEAINHQQ